MIRNIIFLTVFGSYHPYHELVGGNNARKSVEIDGEGTFNRQIDCPDSCNLKELVLAPIANS